MPMRVSRENTYEKTRLSRSTRPKTSCCPRNCTVPYVPGDMRRQRPRAMVGSSTITAFLRAPLRNGSTHAPTISTNAGWIHSTVIVIFPLHEPQLADEFRPDDDHHAGDQPVDRFPRRQVLEPEFGFLRVHETRQRELHHRA